MNYIDNFTRILKSPHLLFYDFSTICYDFSKFSQLYAYNEKEKENAFALGSLQKT